MLYQLASCLLLKMMHLWLKQTMPVVSNLITTTGRARPSDKSRVSGSMGVNTTVACSPTDMGAHWGSVSGNSVADLASKFLASPSCPQIG